MGLEGPETPVDGRSGRNPRPVLSHFLLSLQSVLGHFRVNVGGNLKSHPFGDFSGTNTTGRPEDHITEINEGSAAPCLPHTPVDAPIVIALEAKELLGFEG